jgi:tetratricopeptide (TPR) repeat protein
MMTALQVPQDLLLDPEGSLGADESGYIELRQFKSPITGESFFAEVLVTRPRVVEWDHDSCPRPPINTLKYSLVIDPVTGYVAPPGTFNQPVAWTAEELHDVLGDPKFSRETPSELPWAGAYAWEKFENAARLGEAADSGAMEVANQWLFAAWSVRLDVVSGENEFDSEVEELFSDLPRRQPPAPGPYDLYQTSLARYWEKLRDSGQLAGVSERSLSLALAWLYRSRGELHAAQAWLDSLARAEPQAVEESTLFQYLASSIRLEQDYMQSAIHWLTRAWNYAEITPQKEADAALVLGELCRRTGDLEQARQWYAEARARNLGFISTEFLERQLALVAEGARGY